MTAKKKEAVSKFSHLLSLLLQYFYNAQTQEYLYWDAMSKTYIPVPGGTSTETQPLAMTAEDVAILSNPAADAPLEMKKLMVPPPTVAAPVSIPLPVPAAATVAAPAPAAVAVSTPEPVPPLTAAPERKEEEESPKKDNKDEKPRSLAAVKVEL